MDGDQVVTSQEGKEELLFNYFDGLLGTALPRTATLDLSFFHGEGIDLLVLDPLSRKKYGTPSKHSRQIVHLVRTGLQACSIKHAGKS